MTFARSPVIPNTTKTSARSPPRAAPAERVAAAVTSSSSRVRSSAGVARPLPYGPLVPIVRAHGDPAGALVRQTRPRPVDDRLCTVLVRGQKREVHGPPGEKGRLALHGPPAEHLYDGRAAADRRHRPF